MKKIIAVFSLLALSLFLNACTVNWINDGEQVHYQIPWPVAIPIAVVLIAIGITLFLKSCSEKYYFCSNCNHRFKAKWYKTSGSIKGGSLLKCPKCHKRSYMLVSYDQEKPADEE